MNRLADETSPYLLQHADNPVDWYPWGDEALTRAREEDRPILLSIGYSACHWCHVMERESFEDEQTAGLMNQLFVCIKLDREERPDLDAIYMEAVQSMTGRGVFATTTRPNQGLPCIGRPASAMVGTFGTNGRRLSDTSASARSLPASAWGPENATVSNTMETCPATRSCTAGAAPL